MLLATPNIRPLLPELAQEYGVPFEVAEYVPYEDLMRLYARSRVAISATTVDGMPSFLAEAMAMGALPIHSDMASIREWIVDGDNGLLFPVDDVPAIERSVARWLSDDALFHRAELRNRALVEERLNRKKVAAALTEALQRLVRPTASIRQRSNGKASGAPVY